MGFFLEYLFACRDCDMVTYIPFLHRVLYPEDYDLNSFAMTHFCANICHVTLNTW